MVGVAAVLLAGGRGSRLRGVDKGALLLDGRTLLDRALEVLAGLDVVLVGPPPLGGTPAGVRIVRESPPLAGPAAAVAAAVTALPESAAEALVLAVDLPRLPELVPLLLAAELGPDGVVAEVAGAPQWLTGRYRVAALQRAVAAFGDPRDRPVRRLLGDLRVARLPLPADLLHDVDTVADAQRAGVLVPGVTEAG